MAQIEILYLYIIFYIASAIEPCPQLQKSTSTILDKTNWWNYWYLVERKALIFIQKSDKKRHYYIIPHGPYINLSSAQIKMERVVQIPHVLTLLCEG